jgi:hypothetical protein
MVDILRTKLAKRQVDIRFFNFNDSTESSLREAKQEVELKQGIDQENAKKITKTIKDSKLKVQTSIQGDQVRVTGKNRDDLQETIAMLRTKEFELPLQFENFRD